MSMKEDVEKAINEIRPKLQADGGDIKLIGVDEKNGNVKVELQGACRGCPMSQYTLQMGVLKYLQQKIPAVKTVESV